ncbi:MAG: hypothetical protein NZT92_13095 [Abditibacteriales bacterium]|nr:hypothetical protein [Abditibacteriales bacterium]MDW8364362.1 hypothetical protein [Abditibacteriales bacterium]
MMSGTARRCYLYGAWACRGGIPSRAYGSKKGKPAPHAGVPPDKG